MTMFQSTHSLRSATPWAVAPALEDLVSIHALLAECDRCGELACRQPDGFNPRTPCGVRPASLTTSNPYIMFQSTHSLRSATLWWIVPRPIRGMFQSTHSLRSATDCPRQVCGCQAVSIHALLAECDETKTKTKTKMKGFNPRTPCGVRRFHDRFDGSGAGFQSTHSLRSATCLSHCQRTEDPGVSIHALLAECDMPSVAIPIGLVGFNPRTPCGVRRATPGQQQKH